MRACRVLVMLLCAFAMASSARSQEYPATKGDRPETKADHIDPSPYAMVSGWLKPVPAGWMHPVAVFAESPDRIFVLQEQDLVQPRPERKPEQHFLVVVNRDGKVIEEWGQWDSILKDGHKVSIDPYDPQKHVWVLARDVQQIFKFTNDGKKIVMTLGTRDQAGSDDKHFNRPTDITWLPDGTFFVSDGDAGRRVVKFDKDGKFLTSWSTEEGPLAGFQTASVHGIAVDDRHRVYVATRSRTEGRIIVFDENGKFLSQWKDFVPVERVFISRDGFAWIQEGGNVKGVLTKYDLNGKRLATYDIPGTDLSVDSEGALYSQNFQTGRNGVDKYVPKQGAKPSELVAQRVGDKPPR